MKVGQITPASTTTIPGTVELATDTEAKAVSSQTHAVTPGNLAVVFGEPPALGGTTPNVVTGSTVRVGASDVKLERDAAGKLAQRDGTNAQALGVYNTFTDASNYERLAIQAVAAADFKLVPEAAGTGTLRGLQVGVSGGKLGFYGTAAVTKPAALTAANASTVDIVFGTEERDVVANLRTRLNELESRLQSLGLLT